MRTDLAAMGAALLLARSRWRAVDAAADAIGVATTTASRVQMPVSTPTPYRHRPAAGTNGSA
jgi:hypothetical protein